MEQREYRRKETFVLNPLDFPDIKVYGGDGRGREAHRAVLSRLSNLLHSVLRITEAEEDLAIIIPDVSGPVLDLTLELAYSGWLGGLGLTNISQVRDVCNILDMRQSDFVVRSEDKSWLPRNTDLILPEPEADDVDSMLSVNETRQKIQGSFQCENCDKTFIYAKSFERHLLVCFAVYSEVVSADETVLPDCGLAGASCGTYYTDEIVTADDVLALGEASELSHVRTRRRGRPEATALGDALEGEEQMVDDVNHLEVEEDCGGAQSCISDNCEKDEEGPTDSWQRRKRRRKVAVGGRRRADSGGEGKRESEGGREVFSFVHYVVEGGRYLCKYPGCSYSGGFKTLSNCKNHQLAQHATEEEKVFACSECDERFASNRLRNKHSSLTHSRRFECGVCGRKFAERSRLKIHERVHSGEKPYVCEECGYACTQKDNLKTHKEFRHGKPEKKFACDLCGLAFLSKSNLTRHRGSHSNLKLFQCETCGKDFKDAGALKQHVYSHGESSYNCQICGATFTSPLYLYRHSIRKHPVDGVQPLTCHTCGKGFPLNHQLQEHIQVVHEKMKHCCPHCHQVIGRRTSVNRHLKKGRCPGIKLFDPLDLPAVTEQIVSLTDTKTLP